MMPSKESSRLLAILLVLSSTLAGQAPQAAVQSVIGAATTVDIEKKRITLKTDQGPEVVVLLGEVTTFYRVAPGEKDLKNAAKLAAPDISPGDRLLVRGQVSEDRASVSAAMVVVMTKADIAKKQEADRAEWQKRGVSGTVTALNVDAKQITISNSTPRGSKPLIIECAASTVLRRYAPDTVKFSDAKPGTLAEIDIGDQVRALGDTSQDGGIYFAKEVVSGSFRTVAGTVTSVDVNDGVIRITELGTKKPLLVRITPDSSAKRLPESLAQTLAARNGRAPRPGGAPSDLQQVIDRLSPLRLTDLKPGDALIIASTKGADAARITAITLLAGVEPLFTARPVGGQVLLGNWNLDVSMPLGNP